MDLPLCRLRQIADTVSRRLELCRWEELQVIQWQTRHLAGMSAAAAGVLGDTSELVRAAGEISITGDEEAPRVPAPVRPRTGLEEWEQAAQAAQQATASSHEDVPEEMAGVPAGMSFEDLPEMEGVPAGGPQRQAGDDQVSGAGAHIGAAEALIGVLERGELPHGR